MNKEVKDLIYRLKDSVKNPIVLVPTFDGSDEEEMDNDQCLTANECEILLDYINQLEKQLEHYKVEKIERLNENVLQIRNDCLEGYIKANRIGG